MKAFKLIVGIFINMMIGIFLTAPFGIPVVGAILGITGTFVGGPAGSLMAGLALTRLQEFRSMYNSQYDRNEVKRSEYGALEFFQKETDRMGSIVNDDLKRKARASMGSDLKIPVMDKKTVTLGASRTLTIADDENESKLVTVSFTTLSGGFTMYPARYFNNDMAYQDHYNRHLQELLVAFAEAIEDLCVAKLSAVKSQVNNSGLGYTFTNNQFELGNAQKNLFFSDIPVILKENKFFGPGMNCIANFTTQSFINFLSEQGPANNTNYGYQFAGVDYYYTNNIANAADQVSTFYFCPNNTVGILTRNEPDALANTRLPDGHEWDTGLVPIVNLPMDLYYYPGAVDASSLDGSTAHLTRTHKEAFGFSIDVALVSAYNSDAATYPSQLFKAQIAST